MTVSPDNLKYDGFGTIFQLLNESTSGAGTGTETASTTTTNAVPTTFYTKTVPPAGMVALRATIVAMTSTGAVVGKFVRELTAKRVDLGNAVLNQDLVPSPDYSENAGLEVSCSVSGPNAILVVTGIAATIMWHGLVEVLS